MCVKVEFILLSLYFCWHLLDPLVTLCDLILFSFFLILGAGPFPGLIDLFGGIGGLVEYRASLLAAHGFAVLALAYFAYADLPKQLQEVDLEYFEEAANLLLAHPKVFKILFILPGNIIAKTIKNHKCPFCLYYQSV